MMVRGWHDVNQQASMLPHLLLTVQRSPPCTSSQQLTWSPPRLGSKVTCPSSVRLPTRNWPCSTSPPSCQLWFIALLSIFNRRVIVQSSLKSLKLSTFHRTLPTNEMNYSPCRQLSHLSGLVCPSSPRRLPPPPYQHQVAPVCKLKSKRLEGFILPSKEAILV